MSQKETVNRCEWVNLNNPLYVSYHDSEWGVPSYDDQNLFEMLCLEGQQAGLSWETVLKKRAAYRKHFFQFDVVKVSEMSDSDIEFLLQEQSLIRNKLKLYSIRTNACAVLKLQESSTFSDFLWRYVEGKPIINKWKDLSEIPTSTELSDQMSKDLKKLGFKFIGSTICYAFMQAVGMVNDHTERCFAQTVK